MTTPRYKDMNTPPFPLQFPKPTLREEVESVLRDFDDRWLTEGVFRTELLRLQHRQGYLRSRLVFTVVLVRMSSRMVREWWSSL